MINIKTLSKYQNISFLQESNYSISKEKKVLKKLFLLLLVLFAIGFTAQAGEKITNFKFKYYGPNDRRVYLIDSAKQTGSGYFSLRPFISYSDNNFLYSGLAFSTLSVDDKTSAAFNGKVDTKEIVNLTALYYTYKSFMITTFITSSLGLTGLIAGAIIMSNSSISEIQYVGSGRYDYYGEIMEPQTTYPYQYLFGPGLIVLAASGALFVISAAVFLPIFLYNFIVYGRVKKELLGLLNGFEVSNSAGRNLFRFKFDLVLG